MQINEMPDKQNSLTDPDARSMKTRGTAMVGYNVQAAVDAKHYLIVTHEVTNNGVDRDQLSSVAKGHERSWVSSNSRRSQTVGYFKGEEILTVSVRRTHLARLRPVPIDAAVVGRAW